MTHNNFNPLDRADSLTLNRVSAAFIDAEDLAENISRKLTTLKRSYTEQYSLLTPAQALKLVRDIEQMYRQLGACINEASPIIESKAMNGTGGIDWGKVQDDECIF